MTAPTDGTPGARLDSIAQSALEAAVDTHRGPMKTRDTQARNRRFEEAVDLYRGTIQACRGQGVPYATRLRCETKAWFELGHCYGELGLWNEAAFSFEAVVRDFSKEAVGRELVGILEFRADLEAIDDECRASRPHSPVAVGAAQRAAILYHRVAAKPEYEALFAALESRRLKCATNMTLAARRQMMQTRRPFDRDRYADAVALQLDAHPNMDPLSPFHVGAAHKTQAEAASARGDASEATRSWVRAAGVFEESADKQEAVREAGYYLAATCYYHAMTEVMRLAEVARDPQYDAASLGRKALVWYDSFEDETGATAATGDEADRRALRLEEAHRARSAIRRYLGMSNSDPH